MSNQLRRWSRLLVVLLAACSGANVAPEHGPPGVARAALVASAPFGAAPRLFSRSAGEGQLLELYVPQPGSSAALVTAAPLCQEAQLQALFGIAHVDRVELLSYEDYDALAALPRADWELPCDVAKPRFVYRSAAEAAWRVALAHGEAPASTPDEPPTFVVPIQQSCILLIDHFQVAARAREQRAEPPWPAPDVDLYLPCRPPPPAPPPGGWSADVVLGGDMRPLVQLSQGERKLYLQRIDGVAPSAESQEPNLQVLSSVGSLFKIPVERRTVSLEPVPMPALALDACFQRCDGFVPSHLLGEAGALVCSDRNAPDASGSCPATAPGFALAERLAEDGAQVQDLERSDDPGFLGATLASCNGEFRWARVLGLSTRPQGLPFVAAARAAYIERRARPVVPCVRETDCTVELATGTDLSSPAVLRTVTQTCWRGEDVLTLRLLGPALARGTFTLRSAAVLPISSDALPASITSVRLVGAQDGLVIQAPPRTCGTALCQTETPALSVRGPLRVTLEGITLQAAPGSDVTLPGNRSGIEVKEGATLVLRRTAVGAEVTASTSTAAQLFTGIRLTDATLFAAHAKVRAFATAIDATRAQVAALGQPLGARGELSALAGSRSYGELKNLAGRPMVQVNNFVALRLGGAGTRVFLGGIDLSAPVGLLYLGPGTGAGDVSVVDAYLRWNPDCAGRLFEVESHALELAGTGELRLGAVDVGGYGTLLRCPAPSQAAVVFEGFSTFGAFRQRTDFGACRVATEFALRTQPSCTPSTPGL